jgi:phage tail-like protein
VLNPLQPIKHTIPYIPYFNEGPANAQVTIGLAMRFRVLVDGLSGGTLDLGQWSSCKGLRADYNPRRFRAHGNAGYEHVLPGALSYPVIQLERAMDPVSSAALQKWLKAQAAQLYGEPGATTPVGTTAHIVLMDRAGSQVAAWDLRAARPSAWVGPTLNAFDSKVAIETLELVHEGFL